MSFKNFTVGVLAAMGLTLSLQASEPTRCGGGGPHSFDTISTPIDNNLSWIDSAGAIKDFTPFPRKGALIFRDDKNRVGGVFENYGNNPVIFGSSPYRISRVVDAAEEAILTVGPGDLLNPWSASPYWRQYTKESVIPIFWNGDDLYVMSAMVPTKVDSEYKFYIYQPYTNHQPAVCSFKADPAVNLRMAHGSTFPFVFFYSTHPTRGGNYLALIKFNVKKCKITDTSTFNDPFPGDITDVYRFEALDSLAVKVNNGTENLMWRTPQGCQYFDIGNLAPMVLNTHQPVVATWSKDAGFNLYNLNTFQKARILDILPISGVESDAAWMNDAGTELYVAPSIEGRPTYSGNKLQFKPSSKSPSRWVFKLSLDLAQLSPAQPH